MRERPKMAEWDLATHPFSVSWVAGSEGSLPAAVVSVRGEIDLNTAPGLHQVLLQVLEHGDGPVVVDLSEVEFMDSTGVHLLVDAHKRLEPHNRRLAIACREHGGVHRLLALVGLLDSFSVYGSRESALTGGDGRLQPEPAAHRLGAWTTG
jgi:anti-sigma B factor antagonist